MTRATVVLRLPRRWLRTLAWYVRELAVALVAGTVAMLLLSWWTGLHWPDIAWGALGWTLADLERYKRTPGVRPP